MVVRLSDKLKNRPKRQKKHFWLIFEHMSDSLTSIQVEPHQFPSHQSILLTQGPIHENFMKKYWKLAELDNEVFLSWPFRIFWVGHFDFFLLHLCGKSSRFIQGIIYFCTMDGFSRILERKLYVLFCTQLYNNCCCAKLGKFPNQ